MIHILIISTSLADGGMQRQLSIFLQNFDREKLHITLALLENRIDYVIPDDVPVIHLKRTKRLQLSFYYRLLRVLSDRRYQVINSKISGLNELVMLFCGMLGKNNLLVEIRNTSEKQLPFYKKMGRLFSIFGASWKVVCNSRKAVQEVKKHLPERVSVAYVGNGINVHKFKRLSVTNAMSDALTLGYIGRITPQKNLELLLQSFHEFRSGTKAKLLIVGAIKDNSYYTHLQKLAKELGIEASTEWTGKQADTVKYFNMIDIFIMPSFFEGTPNALLEAMSCECVCLASKGANTDNFLEVEFTFDENNLKDLTQKLLFIHKLDKVSKQKIGENNRAFIIQNYSVDNMVNKMTELYYRIAGESSR